MDKKYEKCEFCGNDHDEVDRRGGCLGCGAQRKRVKKPIPDVSPYIHYGRQLVSMSLSMSSTDSGPWDMLESS